MPLAPAKFPRRFAQRQALRIRSTTSPSDLRDQDVHQRHRLRIIRKRSPGIDKDSDSTGGSDYSIDTDEESEQDSGYASDADAEAEYLNGLVEKFRDMGPQISNLGDIALKMAQKEKSLWQK
jgi:hypothetical protein